MGSYQEPEWAQKPSSASWTLSEIKGGVEVARHDLSARPTTIFGRAVDMVHIPLHHQSISRQHARIAFDNNETPWLRDLQSAHGTIVNKRRLPAQACGKQESNSKDAGARGVILKVGDMIKFGASTRYYTLEGPPPGATKEEKHLEELNKQRNQAPSQDESTKKDDGISWGMNMGDEESSEAIDNNNKSVELDPSKIPEKYRKELDKIQGLKYKLANLENEDSRIRRKGSELSEGQQKQLDRNAEREAALRKTIQEREERLHDKLNYKSNNSSKKRSSYENNYDDDDDDFFDRTKNENDATELGVEDAESEETLTMKWKKLSGERRHLASTVLAKAKHRVDTLRQKLKSMQDSEEAFFVKNDLQLALEAKKKTDSSLNKTNSGMDEIEKLLNVVNPKLQCDRTIGYIGKGPPPAEEAKSNDRIESFSMPAPRQPKAVSMSMGPPAPMGPPPIVQPKKPETTSMPPPPPSMQKDSQSMAPPNNKRKRVIGPAAVPPSNPAVEDRKPPRSKAQRTGTLAFLDRPSSSNTNSNTKAGKGVDNKPSSASAPKPFLSEDSYKMDVWTAPKGQDGSGKTKLNEKFAGRY